MADRKQKRVKQRRGFVDLVNALLTLVVLALLVLGGLFLYGVHGFYAAGPIKADTTFVVEKGNNLSTVAQRLEAEGLIDNRYIFQIGGFATKKQGALKAGEFKLSANASMADVLKELTEGKPVQHGITIPEGFTMAQVVDRLNRDGRLTGDLKNIPPEGGVLPQTYNFEPGVSRQSVLDQMAAAQQKAVADVWASHDPNLPISTPGELVTLASIVEKETGVASERARVAAVFVNRLRKHMRLQSDPTIIYGITRGAAPLGRPLKRSEVEAATPYNTYQVNGLPPTPIDNPGIETLKAVANPASSNDIYFVAVSTNPADGHLFADNYADHKKNVAKLRAAEKQAAAAAEADADAARDALEQQQAEAAGDPSAAAAPAPVATTAPPAGGQPTIGPPSIDQLPAAPDANAPGMSPANPPTLPSDAAAPDQAAPTAPATAAPLPMPADLRPGEHAPTTATPAPTTAPSAPASTAPTRPAPTRPARPRPAPQPEDSFGG